MGPSPHRGRGLPYAGQSGGGDPGPSAWNSSDALAVPEAFAEPVMERQVDAPITTVADAGRWIQRRNGQWHQEVAYGFALADGTGTALGSAEER